MKVVSLFAGIGGFDLALERLGHQIVYANEWDKYAAQIYEKHFAKPDTRDIKTVRTDEIPDHDLLVGGFPCQAFSTAGQRKGFADTRGTLFFDIARILKDKRPRYFLLENVKGLLSHEDGKTFQTILETLTDLGYITQWRVCNSREFGVPQNRERTIIVGSLAGEPIPEVFYFKRDDGKNPETLSDQEGVCASTLTARQFANWNGNFISRYPLKFLGRNQKKIEGDYAYTIDRGHTGGVALYDISYPSRVRKYTEASPTIRDFGSGGNKMPIVNALRKLTPVECERLQGFPDNWTDCVSDTQRYKCLGNAVTVDVIYNVAKGFGSVSAPQEENIEPDKPMGRGPRFKYQREYPYICSGCGKKRWTRKYNRRSDELCTKCEREGAPNENQLSLLPAEDETQTT